MKLFQIIVFLAFTTSVALRYGILPSISDSWYMMKHKVTVLTVYILYSSSNDVL